MDLKAVHAELGKLLAIDADTRHAEIAKDLDLRVTGAEAVQILKQRRAACEARLRSLGFVAAHDSTASTLREFRDREDRKVPAVVSSGVPIPMYEQQRSAASLGFSD